MLRILLRMSHERVSKTRPNWFEPENMLKNLLDTMDDECSLTVLFDGDPKGHFVVKYPVSVVRFSAGSDAASFGKLLIYVFQQHTKWQPSDILYLLEDDYFHRPCWPKIMREAFQGTECDIVSLFDHPDRYSPGSGACRLVHTASCHWRTAISTTNTFALLLKTLLEDIEIHARFVESGIAQGHHADHEKHIMLYRQNKRVLVTSVPGYSTHCETEYLSPCFDWPGTHTDVGKQR